MVTRLNIAAAIFFQYILLTKAAVYVADPSMNRMIEFSLGNQPCKVHANRVTIDNMLRRIDSRYVHRMDPQDLDDLTNSCQDPDQYNKRGGFIFPGTKWCGPGDIANGYNDLGIKADEDRCCREHDHCPNQLEPGQCRQGICNMSPFTRSHCDCDNAFRRCLNEVNSDVANTIGTLYFNVAQVTCFKDRRSCPQWMRECKMQFHGMAPFPPKKDQYFRDKEEFVSNFVSGLLNEFFRYKTYKKDDLSYAWFCEEWKFTPSDKYIPSIIIRENHTNHINEIPDEGRRKSSEGSKIDQDLEILYGKDSENIEKIMNDRKPIRK